MATARPYQVCLYCGKYPPKSGNMTIIDVTPDVLTPEGVIDKLKSCGITPADLRARTVFLAECDIKTFLMVYSAIIGFSSRRIDVAVGSDLLEVLPIHNMSRSLEDDGKPAETLEFVQVGAEHQLMPYVTAGATITPEQVSLIRYARQARFVPLGDDVISVANQFLLVSGIRSRNNSDRLPALVEGNEPLPAPVEEGSEEPQEVLGVDLDSIRREAIEYRRTQRFDERSALAEKVELSKRQKELIEAAAVPVEETLIRLGASFDAETELWHCPRPSRHTNGDANASMKVNKGLIRCFRCDAEHVDSLRLVMDTLALSADEAAQWLKSDAKLPAITYGPKA